MSISIEAHWRYVKSNRPIRHVTFREYRSRKRPYWEYEMQFSQAHYIRRMISQELLVIFDKYHVTNERKDIISYQMRLVRNLATLNCAIGVHRKIEIGK